MRLSANQDDSGYAQFAVCKLNKRWPTVLVDGVKIDNVVTADDVVGFATYLVTDCSGSLIVDPVTESAKTETVHGRVSFQFEPR